MAEDKRSDKRIILQEIFRIFSLAILSFVILELLWPNSVLGYININILLLIWLAVGILLLVINKENK